MKRIIAISGSHGCFGRGTKIRMSDNKIKEVQNIQTNEYVMGDNFIPRKVVAIWRGYENLYKFDYYDGSSHVYNEHHMLALVRNKKYRAKNYNIKATYLRKPIYITVKEFINLKKQEQQLYYKSSRYNIRNIRSARDLNVATPIKYNYRLSKIKTITPLGKGTYYGFTLESRNLFLHEDGTVLANCGKSTMAYSLCSFLKKLGKNVVVLNELARECPFDINQKAEDKTHIWLATKQVTKELEYSDLYEYVITDRSVLDAFAYGSVLANDKNWSFKKLEPYLVEHIKNNYKCLYILEPRAFNFNVEDGVRDTNETFRLEVHKALVDILEKNKIEYTMVFNNVDIFLDFI